MGRNEQGDITGLLGEWSAGRRTALDELMTLVHRELRSLAAVQLRIERPNHTLQPSALVNEVFLKLVSQRRARWESRGQFFAVAARTMRRVLVDYARRRRAAKRGAEPKKVALESTAIVTDPGVELLDLERALSRLEALDPQQAQVVELRIFAGCTIEETAEALGISPATVKREWRMGQVWLQGELGSSPVDET